MNVTTNFRNVFIWIFLISKPDDLSQYVNPNSFIDMWAYMLVIYCNRLLNNVFYHL